MAKIGDPLGRGSVAGKIFVQGSLKMFSLFKTKKGKRKRKKKVAGTRGVANTRIGNPSEVGACSAASSKLGVSPLYKGLQQENQFALQESLNFRFCALQSGLAGHACCQPNRTSICPALGKGHCDPGEEGPGLFCGFPCCLR